MLVLSRKIRERLVIGDSIVITVIDTKRGRVRLGIEAPPDVSVLREEVYAQAARKEPAGTACAAARR
ncbi:MAG: carbon storage regulator [Gemmataceae bacterium]|nr:carbon storage regulator [Gemmataceae bacterium]